MVIPSLVVVRQYYILLPVIQNFIGEYTSQRGVVKLQCVCGEKIQYYSQSAFLSFICLFFFFIETLNVVYR